jgi:hypothetical protein
MNCRLCRINLRFAAEHPEHVVRTEPEAIEPVDATPQAVSQRARGAVTRVVLGCLSLVVGAFGIVPLFAIGEGTGSGLAAYAALSLIFALLAFVVARIDPGAWWAYALLLCAPVALLSLSAPGSDYFAVAMLMIVITMAGGFCGASGRRVTPKPRDPSPSR